MDKGVIVFLIAVLAIGLVTLVIVIISKRGGSQLNIQKYQSQWLSIEASLKRDEPASAQLAILNADKLVDLALRERGFKGQTMGERMKSAQPTWKNANHIWGAHKIRNRIAHEPDINITYDIARRALTAYKQALKDLGAI